jgi:multiple sugar transport system permease protein
VFTLPIGLETFFQQYSTEWGAVMAMAVFMLLPPVLLFLFASKYFRIGGIGGSVVG